MVYVVSCYTLQYTLIYFFIYRDLKVENDKNSSVLVSPVRRLPAFAFSHPRGSHILRRGEPARSVLRKDHPSFTI